MIADCRSSIEMNALSSNRASLSTPTANDVLGKPRDGALADRTNPADVDALLTVITVNLAGGTN